MSGPTRLSLALLSLALAACQASATPGAICAHSAECGSPLVCRYGRCRAECSTNRDCGASQSCLYTADHEGVCQLEADLDCEGGVGRMCPTGLVCANDRCINPCTTNADCPSDGACQFSPTIGLRVCVDPGRVDLDAGPRPDGGVPIHSCFADAAGLVTCTGSTAVEELGTPSALAVLGSVRDLALGLHHSCALTQSGVRCWGSNGLDQLGVGALALMDPGCTFPPCSFTPVDVALPAVADLVDGADADTACAITLDGHLACWGENASGEVDGTLALAPSPIVRNDLPGVVCDAAIGSQTICALVASSAGGDVYCWGANPNGQLGVASDGVAHASPMLITTTFPPPP